MSVFYQILGTAIACLLSLSMGVTFAWPSSTVELFSSPSTPLSRPMSTAELALFGSLSSVGALVGTPLAGYFLDRLGRKYCAVLASLAYVISWSLIAMFNQVEVILLALFIAGTGAAAMLIVRIYVSEICQESIRGAMPTGSLVFFTMGLLLSYLLGGYLEYKNIVYVCLSVAVLGTVSLGLLRESPTFLMMNGREEEAAMSIAFYRRERLASEIVQKEMDALRRAFNPQLDADTELSAEEQKLKPGEQTTKNISLWKFIKKSRSTRRAFYVTTILVTASIFQGISVIQVYSEPLFHMAVPNMSSTLCSVTQALITLATGLVAAFLTDVAGRRPLLISSSIAAGACCLALGTELHYFWAPNWTVAMFIYLFCATYTIGAGCVPYVLVTDFFLPEVKSSMSMFIIQWSWFCSFILLYVFGPLTQAIGLGFVFYIFAVICFLTAAFTVAFLPETKGMPVDAIQLLFD